MNVEFFEAKDGNQTVRCNNILLHSSYSPVKEAERFVKDLKSSFEPDFVIINEPILAYCLPFLRKRFPDSKIGAIRFCKDFDSYNKAFDFVFNYENLENTLLKNFTEEQIFSTLFISWKPSEQCFKLENEKVIASIKNALEKSRTLLVTRQFFEKKWLLNSLNFISYSKSFIKPEKISLPFLIIASGPSLKPFINIIREYQKNFFIVALSSSIECLLKYNIHPDLCFSTDGGFWANKHLKALTKEKIPLALSAEGFCSKKILQKNNILPLVYCDGLSKKIADKTKIFFTIAKRNGTVSGTALEFALNFCSSTIFFAGLDLHEGNGFSHTQPNLLENENSVFDNKITSKEKRITKSNFNTEALRVYENWFKNFKLEDNKVFRLMENQDKKNNLNHIKDIASNEFLEYCHNSVNLKNDFHFKLKEYKLTKAEKTELYESVATMLKDEKNQKQIFPLDYIALKHNPQNCEIKDRLLKENQRLLKKIKRILQDE